MSTRRFVMLLVAASLLLIAVLACGGSTATPASPSKSAYGACIYMIDRQFGLPMNDAQDYVTSMVNVLGNNQYRVKILYAKYKSLYYCTVERLDSGDWKLIDLELQ